MGKIITIIGLEQLKYIYGKVKDKAIESARVGWGDVGLDPTVMAYENERCTESVFARLRKQELEYEYEKGENFHGVLYDVDDVREEVRKEIYRQGELRLVRQPMVNIIGVQEDVTMAGIVNEFIFDDIKAYINSLEYLYETKGEIL